MTKSQKFKKEYAHELMLVAVSDLDTARTLSNAKLKRVENIFLFVQQALEKALKAVLCWYEQPVPLIHDIGILTTKIENLGHMAPFGYDFNSLSEYATIRRYLEGKESFDTEEIDEIINQVDVALKWCQSLLI